MNFPKFSEWMLVREEVTQNGQVGQTPTAGTTPVSKQKIDPKTSASIKKKIAAASTGGKFNRAQFIKSLEGDLTVSPDQMMSVLGGNS